MELVLAALLFTTLLMSVAIIVTEILDELRRRKRAISLRWISFGQCVSVVLFAIMLLLALTIFLYGMWVIAGASV